MVYGVESIFITCTILKDNYLRMCEVEYWMIHLCFVNKITWLLYYLLYESMHHCDNIDNKVYNFFISVL